MTSLASSRRPHSPMASSPTRTYDPLGRLESATDERGNTTTYAYDPGCGCSDRVTA